jgi:hypothetical protein
MTGLDDFLLAASIPRGTKPGGIERIWAGGGGSSRILGPARAAVAVSLAACTLLAACGAGVAAVVAGTSGSSSGSTPALNAFVVESPRVSPAKLVLDASQAVSVALFFDTGQGELPMQHLTGVAGNEVSLAAGVNPPIEWDFAAEIGAGFTPGVRLVARHGGAPISGGELTLGLGNDAPEILSIQPVTGLAGEATGNVEVGLSVSDSSSDLVSIQVEWRRASDAPDDWKPATVGGVPEDVGTSTTGVSFSFFWKTDADGLGGAEADFFLRLTARDGTPTGIGRLVSPSFRVDNNAAPIGVLEDGLLALDPDETRGIAIPFTILDAESDPVEVVFQWRREDQAAFPELPLSVSALRALLADPVQRREKQICSEQPLAYGGRELPPPPGLDPATHMTLPEIASTASPLLAAGVVGRTLEILRASQVPEPVAEDWQVKENPLAHPVAVLPVGSGPTALVLDAPESDSWRLREIDLASGRIVAGESRGSGDPTAMDYEPGQRAVIVAAELGDLWSVARVELASWTVPPVLRFVPTLIAAGDPGDETGEVGGARALACLGTGASLITVGSSLVRLDYPLASLPAEDQAAPRAVKLWGDLSTPWGVVLDPLRLGRIYLAERDHAGVGRVSSLELDTYRWTEVVVHPDTPAGAGLVHPTAIALERNGARLLALTDADLLDATRELRAVNIGGREAGVVSEIAGGLGADAGALVTGPDHFRMLAAPDADDIAVGGGLLKRRIVQAFDPRTRTVRVDPPFDPPPASNETWRMTSDLGLAQGAPDGHSGVFVWDSSDVPHGVVHLRIVPLDTDVGLSDEGQAGKQIRRFEGPLLLGSQSGANQSVLADLDLDGRLDLISSGAFPSALNLYLGREDGRFPVLPDHHLTGPGLLEFPQGLAVADLNGDGRPDIACGNIGSPSHGAIAVFLQPDGGFVDATAGDLRLGSTSPNVDRNVDVDAADLDRDGDLDLVAANSRLNPLVDSLNNLLIFYQPQGGFADAAAPDVILQPVPRLSGFIGGVDTADLNGDGWIDLVSNNSPVDFESNPRPRTATIFLQKVTAGAGSFSQIPAPALSGHEFRNAHFGAIEGADIDADGRVDVIWPFDEGLACHLQSTEEYGGFADQPDLLLSDPRFEALSGPIAADVDGDRRTDLVAIDLEGGRAAVFRSVAEGSASAETVLEGLDTLIPLSPSPADLDGDGRVDITLTLIGEVEAGVFYQEAPGAFASTPEFELGTSRTTDRPRDLAAGDVDGDGLLDLVSANGDPLLDDPDVVSDNVTVFLQRPAGRFASDPDVVLGGPAQTRRPQSVVAADLDGDGRLDIATANMRPSKLAVFRGGLFTRAQPSETRSEDVSLTSAPMERTPAAPRPALHEVSTRHAHLLLAAEIEHDHVRGAFLRLLDDAAMQPRGEVAPGGFAATPDLVLGTSDTTDRPRDLVAGDLDGDGLLDLVSANGEALQSDPDVLSDNVTVFFQRPAGRFAADPDVVLGGPARTRKPQSVVAADLDGDGRLDVATANLRPDKLSVFRGGLVTRLEPDVELVSPALSGPQGLTTADLNGDGVLDLATANVGSSNGTVFFQTGPGAFAPEPCQLGSVTTPRAIAAADLDGDGRVDLTLHASTGKPTVFYQPVGGFPQDLTVQPDVTLELGLASGGSAKRRIVAADLNGDGLLDVAENVPQADRLAVWFQPSTGFAAARLPDLLVASSGRPWDLVVVDLDQDGCLDLASANSSGESLTVFRQQSLGLFSSTPDTVLHGVFSGDSPAALLAADLNGDGELDLASGLHREVIQGSEEGASDVIAVYFAGK